MRKATVIVVGSRVTAPSRSSRHSAIRLQPLLASVWAKVLALLVVLGAWQLVYLSGWKSSVVLPSPAAVGATLWRQLHDAVLWEAVSTTIGRAIVGFGLSLLIGTVLGSVLSRNKMLRNTFGPLITGLQTMPAIAWFPFAIIFFGLNTSAILFVIVIGAAPSVALGVIAGSDQIPPLQLRAAKTMGLRRFALYRHVILPASLPTFVSGLRQGWAFAWRSLMAGELVVMVAGTASIGVLLENAQNMSDMPLAISVMIVVLLIGIVVDSVFGAADRQIRRYWGLVDDERA
jgi:NitT/TauT family transport system permease protein